MHRNRRHALDGDKQARLQRCCHLRINHDSSRGIVDAEIEFTRDIPEIGDSAREGHRFACAGFRKGKRSQLRHRFPTDHPHRGS